MNPDVIVQLIVNGLLIGGIYSLVSMGLTLIWGVMDVVNFAQGELLMIAMYVTWIMYSAFGLNPYFSVLVSFITLFMLGVIIQKFLISRVIELSMAARIYVTFGLSLFLVNSMLMLMTGRVRSIPSDVSTIVVYSIYIDIPHLISFIFSIATALGMYLFLMKTRIGKALRAVSQNRVVASAMGINVRRMYLVSFGLGSALTGIAGSLIMAYYSVTPTVGTSFMLSAFAAVVLGSMGNFVGAFFAGLIIGVAETLGGYFIGPSLKQAVSFVILVIVLLIRPSGLLGKQLGKERIKEGR